MLKIKRMNKKILRLLILFIIPFTTFAQDNNDDKLMLSGEVSEYFSEKSMAGVSVKVTSNGEYVSNVLT